MDAPAGKEASNRTLNRSKGKSKPRLALQRAGVRAAQRVCVGTGQRSGSTIVPESAVVLKRVRGYRIVLRTASFRQIPAQPVDTSHTADRHRRFRARPSVDAEHEFFAPAPTRPQHRATEREVHRRVFLRRVEREGRRFLKSRNFLPCFLNSWSLIRA